MQTKPPAAAPYVDKAEEKTNALRTFITAALLAPANHLETSTVSLVARSESSPVARAVFAMGSELSKRGIVVRAIFAQLDAAPCSAGWIATDSMVQFARDLRWARNPRLGDAHEQLVLGTAASWTGDCLRRDPYRRDVHENFSLADEAATRILQISFNRLWAASEALNRGAGSTARSEAPVGAICAQVDGQPLVSTH